MKLLNLPPFKVGDRVRVVTGGNRDYLVTELRNKDRKWEIKLNGWWYTATWFMRINENTTEESPSGATVEHVMRSGNQYPPTRVVESVPSTVDCPVYRCIVDFHNGLPVYIPQANPVQAGVCWLPDGTQPITT